MSDSSAVPPMPDSIRGRNFTARPAVWRGSRVDQLLAAIDLELDNLRRDRTLLRDHPHAAATLERHHEAARLVVLSASYAATIRRLPARVEQATRRVLDNSVAEDVLAAIGQAYGVPQ